jgi:hypothetical protein
VGTIQDLRERIARAQAELAAVSTALEELSPLPIGAFPEREAGSPLDVEGVDLGLTKEEIVQFVHEGRRGA